MSRLRIFSLSAVFVAFLALPSLALASRTDRDRDGLTAKQEKKLGTNPRKADTDRDKLKDGREVKLGTDPLSSDSDSDGLKDGREVKLGSNPRNHDSDGDGTDDGDQYKGPEANAELKGSVSELTADSFTILTRKGPQVVVVAPTTLFRVADANDDGLRSLADLKVGDRVEVKAFAASGELQAVKVEVDSFDDYEDDTPGSHDDGDSSSELKGSVSSVSELSFTVIGRDGAPLEIGVSSSTRFELPDRNGDGVANLADLGVGDRVEVKYSQVSGSRVASKVQLDD